mmetsp:Transcript_39804/g.119701  ORF Transcript_39804/g.119701 Transcript_39804/m.119701 type:complete len:266 (+) Transcript_39804:1954-2751(+)
MARCSISSCEDSSSPSPAAEALAAESFLVRDTDRLEEDDDWLLPLLCCCCCLLLPLLLPLPGRRMTASAPPRKVEEYGKPRGVANASLRPVERRRARHANRRGRELFFLCCVPRLRCWCCCCCWGRRNSDGGAQGHEDDDDDDDVVIPSRSSVCCGLIGLFFVCVRYVCLPTAAGENGLSLSRFSMLSHRKKNRSVLLNLSWYRYRYCLGFWWACASLASVIPTHEMLELIDAAKKGRQQKMKSRRRLSLIVNDVLGCLVRVREV